MQKQSVWQRIVVDWEAGQYATVGDWSEENDWDGRIAAAQSQGRDIHSFTHDGADTSGLATWAQKHGLTETDVETLLPAF